MRRLLAFVVVITGAASLAGAPQAPPPRDSQRLPTSIAPPSGTGRLTGRVVAADGGEPLRNTRVSLSPAAADVPLVLTDGDGRFASPRCPPAPTPCPLRKRAMPCLPVRCPYSSPRPPVRTSRCDSREARRLPAACWTTQGNQSQTRTCSSSSLSKRGACDPRAPAAQCKPTTSASTASAACPPGVYRGSCPHAVAGAGSANRRDRDPGAACPGRRRSREHRGFRTASCLFPRAPTLTDAEAVRLNAGEERLAYLVRGGHHGPAPGRCARARPNACRTRCDRPGHERDSRPVLGTTGPLSGAEVRIAGDAIRQLPPALTDGLGQYQFAELPAGVYTLNARKSRYIPRAFGQEGTSIRNAHYACR